MTIALAISQSEVASKFDLCEFTACQILFLFILFYKKDLEISLIGVQALTFSYVLLMMMTSSLEKRCTRFILFVIRKNLKANNPNYYSPSVILQYKKSVGKDLLFFFQF